MVVEWSEQYKTGDAALDSVQQQLFELTNSFLASDDLMVLRPIIVALCKQMRAHFDLEETLMRRVNFPGLAQHIEQHQMLLTRLMGRSMDVGKGHMNKPAITALLQEWATRHVPEEDAALAALLAVGPLS